MNKLAFFLGLFTTTSLYSQSVLITINKDTIYTQNFLEEYSKSLDILGTDTTIDNFIDYQLIKQYGLSKGVDKSVSYLKELSNKHQMIQDSLYYPQEILKPLLQDYFNKLQLEKKVQIFIFNKDNFKDKSVDEQKLFIDKIIRSIKNNTKLFEKAASEYSVESKWIEPKYLDIFSINKNLLDAIYDAPIGRVVTYKDEEGNNYLILVSEEREWLGQVRLEEIKIDDPTDNGKLIIEAIYKQLKNGDKLENVKQKYSKVTDKTILLKHFKNKEIYNYIISQKNKLPLHREYSKPIKTNEGYVIYKLVFLDEFKDYNLANSKIFYELKQNNLLEELDRKLIDILKKKPFFNSNSIAINNFINNLPNNFKEFSNYSQNRIIDLIKIGSENNEDYILTNQKLLDQLKYQLTSYNYSNRKFIVDELINNWQDTKLIEFYKENFYDMDDVKKRLKLEEDQLLVKYTVSLLTNQSYADDEGQQKFLNDHKSKYIWKERIDGTFYYCLNQEVEKELLTLLKNNKSVGDIKNFYKAKTDHENNPLVIIEQGKFPGKFLGISSDTKLSKGIKVLDSKNRRLVMDIKNIIKDEPLSLEDLKKYYIKDYVDYKIQENIKQMKNNAVINKNIMEINTLKKKYN
ncbi:hypothetical protein ETU09_08625 [Apibacter muscae]|uniref:Peptidylprolyl isomerase n=1 Tax=Apibacter muscae TaxID=2509004 RepID=A0A563D920_9FLAO|nr:hypothetical protein [Apibacter muscae]TWP26617.1 hypothetical protein ETU09_08625 [Apibacter muscae]